MLVNLTIPQISVELQQADTLEVSLEATVVHTTDIEHYKGDYSITPDSKGKILETSNKFMEQDVQIKPIPVYTVDNKAGGNTVTIGGIFNGTV